MVTVATHINPQMLIWARETQGIAIDDVAKNADLKKIQLWETGAAQPTMNQLRVLAHLYRRPSALFFMRNPPEMTRNITDFRSVDGHNAGKLSPETITEIRVCESRRKTAMELAESLGEDTRFLLQQIRLNPDVEEIANRVRIIIGADMREINVMKDDKSVLEYWINRLERINLLVFHSITLNGWNPSFREIRGVGSYYDEYPWVLLNSQEHPHGQLFTLGHELAHILLHAGGLCTLEENESSKHIQTERYCNGFSAALLMPKDMIREVIQRHHLRFASPFEIDNAIRIIHEFFNTSMEATARRLVTLNIIPIKEYQRIREEQIKVLDYERELRRNDEGGGGKYYYKRVLNWNGVKYSSLVINALNQEKISLGAAAASLRTSVSHLNSIQRELYG